MGISRLLPIALFCILTCGVAAQDLHVIETGSFHEEEVSVTDGEIWLGLYKRGGSYMLMPSILSVQSVHDPIVDTDGESSGKSITVPGMGEPFFLITGSGFKQARPAITLESVIGEIDPRKESAFEMDGKKYVLAVKSENKSENEFIQARSSLVLSDGNVEQVLFEVEECSFCRWRVHWAGDIDSDGKPDFYLYVTHHYNVANQKLFLSSKAGSDRLVEEAAEFTTTGC